MYNNTHDRCGTASNNFDPYLRDLPMKFWEIYQKCPNSVNFWARKMFFFFKWVRISPEIDWYHYQGASPALTFIVRHQTLTKTLTRWSVTSEPSVGTPVFHKYYGYILVVLRRIIVGLKAEVVSTKLTLLTKSWKFANFDPIAFWPTISLIQHFWNLSFWYDIF